MVECLRKILQIKMNNFEKVYEVVRKIPKGRVATYGQIAKFVGIKNPRLVGHILHKNSNPHEIPCHRVVNSIGRLAYMYTFGGEDEQQRKLLEEGLDVTDHRVNIQKYLWSPH